MCGRNFKIFPMINPHFIYQWSAPGVTGCHAQSGSQFFPFVLPTVMAPRVGDIKSNWLKGNKGELTQIHPSKAERTGTVPCRRWQFVAVCVPTAVPFRCATHLPLWWMPTKRRHPCAAETVPRCREWCRTHWNYRHRGPKCPLAR